MVALLDPQRLAEPEGRAPKKGPEEFLRALPLLGSNQDSSDPESDVLPVTPRGIGVPTRTHMELRGIEPLTSAMRKQRSPS
jgi:hypothetical protein